MRSAIQSAVTELKGAGREFFSLVGKGPGYVVLFVFGALFACLWLS